MTRNDRKLILVRGDLLQKAAKITASEGRTLFSLTNEIFEQAIEAYDQGIPLGEAIEFYRMMKNEKGLGFVVIPSDLLNYMAKTIFTIGREKLLSEWYESGLWNGSYLGLKYNGQDKLKIVDSFIKSSLWNLDEFAVSHERDSVTIRCFAPNLNRECVEIWSSFLDGMMNSLGYTARRQECLRGIITLEIEGKKEVGIQPEIEVEV